MATGLTHSFTRKADIMMSPAVNQRHGEQWDITPDPKDPHEQRADEGRTEFGVFGPVPSNPAKRARYMLLANYLELVGSGSTMGGANEREKREEEQLFERAVCAHTIQQIDEQLYQAREEMGHMDFQLAEVRREIVNHQNNLVGLQRAQAATQERVDTLQTAVQTDTAEIKSAAETMQQDRDTHVAAKDEINEKIRLAQEKVEKEREDLLKKFGLEYDPKTHKYFEIREDGSRRVVELNSRMEIASSSAFIEMQNAQFEVFQLKEKAGLLDERFKQRQKEGEEFLAAKGKALAYNDDALAKARIELQRQTEEIEVEKRKIAELKGTEAEILKAKEQLQIKIDTLEKTRENIVELQENNTAMRDQLAAINQYRETKHTDRLALFANDPQKLAEENESYSKYQTAYAGVCSVGSPTQVADLTGNFNGTVLDQLNKVSGSKGPGPETQETTVAAATVDPVNGDTSANAASVADPEKPAEQKQEVAEAAAEQPAVTQDNAVQPNQPKKVLGNTNTGMG